MNEKEKILIVEDDIDNRFILEKLLQINNYDIKTAVDGIEALEVIKEFSPKVIIADWTMPKLDGVELCKIIKEKDNTKLIYFILLTARASTRDIVSGFNHGADDFLVKPIENEEILARIRAGIRIYNLQNELKKIEHTKALVEMACTIGHQINNPLSSLILSVDSVSNELNEAQRESLEDDILIIKKSLDRIKDSIKALINLKNPEVVNYAGDNSMIKVS